MKISVSHEREFYVAAVVVLYFPDEHLLKKLLASLKCQSVNIIVVDNTPVLDMSWLNYEWFIDNKINATYKVMGDNYGIAKAQNEGVSMALSMACSHVIFFDQDSNPDPKMINQLLAAENSLISKGVNVGAVGPAFYDNNTQSLAKVIRFGGLLGKPIGITDVEHCPISADVLIASGSLIRLQVLRSTGMMREELFIDGVDVEWCLRAKYLGYHHFVIPTIAMSHNMGDSYVRIFNRKIILHNDTRHYYSLRNHCNLLLNPIMGSKFRVNTFIKIPIYILIYSILSKSPIITFFRLINACFDGLNGKLGRVSFPN